jgi:hypothetical protein
MKKVFFIVCALVFVSSLCFAETTPIPAQQTLPAAVKSETITASVDSVSLGDAAAKTKSEITVVDAKGQKLTFAVKDSTAISAKDGKTTTLDTIVKGTKVTIEYSTSAKGKNKAKSIKVVE